MMLPPEHFSVRYIQTYMHNYKMLFRFEKPDIHPCGRCPTTNHSGRIRLAFVQPGENGGCLCFGYFAHMMRPRQLPLLIMHRAYDVSSTLSSLFSISQSLFHHFNHCHATLLSIGSQAACNTSTLPAILPRSTTWYDLLPEVIQFAIVLIARELEPLLCNP